jgi:serine/threonine-protein kinase
MIIKGQKINNRYQIIRSIGEGGMANVYLAYDTILDRNVAVKILRGDLATDEKFVRRFQREAISASSLSHPNIVEMYDVGEDDGNYFIVMEYIDGKTLKSLIKRRGALTLPEVIDIMLQLTSAISCAHDSYIIHRDIKPQNVMILDDGRVKITDFGIAIASNATELTQTNSVMGSVHYLPPEQANGQGATIKSDIYSLGILMFELITGHVPFKGDNAVEIALKQMKEPLPNVCKLVDGVPQSMENIILKACAKNPRNRYDSAREMYSDLKECLDEEAPIQQRVVYRYPEDDLEETKTLTNLREVSRSEKRRKMEKEEIQESKEDDIEDLQEKKQSKKLNIALWISGIIVAIIGMAMVAVIFIIPALTKAKDVKIPDVSGMTVEKAEAALIKAGLEVDVDVTEEESDEVEEGLVIETSPKANRTVKEGQTIKLTVSLGQVKIEIEDYTNKNYLEVKGALETLGLKVTIEKKDVEETEGKEYDANIIIDQSIKKGEKVEKDTEIILYTPNVLVKYPDFTTYTLEQITAWCNENKITLTVEYEETSTYPAGTIMYQSRDVGDIVVPNATLKIGVAKVATTTPDTTTTTTGDN